MRYVSLIFSVEHDIRASCINEAMQLAAVHAIKDLAREPTAGSH